MDETIYVIFKVQFDFALEKWFSIYGHHFWVWNQVMPKTILGSYKY